MHETTSQSLEALSPALLPPTSIKPKGAYLLVEVQFSPYFTTSGLVLPESKDSVLLKGRVLEIGSRVRKMGVHIDELVVFSSRAMLCRTGQWIDERHALIHEDNIVSAMEEDAHVTN